MTDRKPPSEQVDLDARIALRWETRVTYKTEVSLREVLEGLDLNGEDTFDEEGNCRFVSVDAALAWARTGGVHLGWAEDWTNSLETPGAVWNVDFNTYDLELRAVPKAGSGTAEQLDNVSDHD